jgi:protein-S-isoprenylcysteine O-methyltransferase Ste14
MNNLLRYLLPLYLVLYLAIAFFWRSFLVWRRTGVNPYVLGNKSTAHDLIGRLFKLLFLTAALVILIHTFAPPWYQYLAPIDWLGHPAVTLAGIILLAFSLIWVVIAQAQMGSAWRIGIDMNHPTELIQTGLFRVSRNPIFLGMRVNLIGLLFVLPNAAMLAIVVVGEVMIQIQIRLEEEHLTRVHGELYLEYCRGTRRWL